MSALAMNPSYSAPLPKPLPGYSSTQSQQRQQQYANPAPDTRHTRTRTNSSAVMPANGSMNFIPDRTATMLPVMSQQQQPPQQGYATQGYPQPARRTLSNATSSTSSTSTNAGMQRAPTGTSAPRRSTSSRSTASASPSSYVALMRKQKATVWCDRAQHEDPRILAAQRQAKMRAAMEVAGGHNHAPVGSRVSTSSQSMVGGVRSKIRHHGAPKASTYTSGNLGGAGVPMRLSATEVDENDSDDDAASQFAKQYHNRNGSGRSSLGSGHRNQSSTYGAPPKVYSNGSTPPAPSPVESIGELLEEETPMPGQNHQALDYFSQPGDQGGSGSSGGSIQREESFGGISGLPKATRARMEQDRKTSEELRRRGSVDDRTMTMGGGRLFVANPDLSD